MTEPVTSLIETVNQLRMQYHATGTELTADAASQILNQKMQQGAFAGQSISPLDIDSAVAQSFGLAEIAATTSSALAVLWDVVTQVAQDEVCDAHGVAVDRGVGGPESTRRQRDYP